MKEYAYDVFLSFTGADRELKNSIRCHLEENGLSCYDSDLYCNGHFREDFCEALDRSRLYLMILTDNLRNDPMISQSGCLTEVRRECSLACQLEAANELNIVILCMSEFFRYDRPFHDYNDVIGWHFYSHTRGFSMIYGKCEEDGALSGVTLGEINSRCNYFVDRRNDNMPVLSQMPKIDIATEKLLPSGIFKGREAEIDSALKAFSEGKQTIVLWGKGGFGKTTLATEIARRCEELGYLNCPQIVHIQELAGGEDGLHTVVSSVNYSDTVYDSLYSLAERERYERKLGALRALPETVLLVIDNYNTLTSDDVEALISKLKCRVLITTRANVDLKSDSVEFIPVKSLEEPLAYEMFCELSGVEVDKGEFSGLYTYVGGHTITLCIMAKIIAVHKMSISDLLDEMDRADELETKVVFRHNDYGETDTVLGHLKNLFSISDLSDKAMHILRSMSLLGDGTIAVSDLMRVLGLKNRNEIIELTKKGWLDLQNVETEEGTQEYLYLHPILSLLMANLLTPTEDDTGDMINYIVSTTDAAKNKLTYADATVLEDGLFYACYVLAGGSHRLSRELWSRFMDVNHLLGDADNTNKKISQLAARVSDDNERSIITAYGDMVTLEQHPTRVELFEKYIKTLEQNANDYKWVMRCLSVTLKHIIGVEKFKPFIKNAITKAFDAAMLYDDHFAMLDLIPFSIVVNGKDGKLLKKLGDYIKRQKKSGTPPDSLLYLELYYNIFSMMKFDSADDMQKGLNEIASTVFEDGGKWGLKLMVKHPVHYIRVDRISSKLEKVETDDPVLSALKLVYGEAYRAFEDGQMDMMTIIQAAVDIHMYRIEQQHTLASAKDSIMGVINMLNAFPESVVRKSANVLAEGVDMNNVSVKALSDLQVAAIINLEYGNKEAIEQSRQVIRAIRHLRPEGHNDIIHALVSFADICSLFGEDEQALGAYVEVYKLMAANSPDSSQLTDISKKLLRNSRLSVTYGTKFIRQVCDRALAGLTDTDEAYYSVYFNYAKCLLDKAKYRKHDKSVDPALEEVWSVMRTASSKFRKMKRLAQNSVLVMLEKTTDVLLNMKQFEKAEEIRGLIKPLRRSRYKSVRNGAHISYLKTGAYRAYRQNDNDAALNQYCSVIKECVKRHCHLYEACNSVVFALHSLRGAQQDDPIGHFIKNEQALKTLKAHEELFLDKRAPVFEAAAEELSAEKLDSFKRFFFYDRIKMRASVLLKKDMNIKYKRFKKMRSTEDFFREAFENILMDLIYN